MRVGVSAAGKTRTARQFGVGGGGWRTLGTETADWEASAGIPGFC
jgi:hypothetical protein